MTSRGIYGCAIAIALAAACGGTTSNAGPGGSSGGTSGGVDPSAPTGALPCNVDTILEQSCRKCHSSPPQYGAPMPLVTLADLHAPAKSDPSKKVYERVAVRIADDVAPMPQPPNARLAPAERDVLTSWANAGAPADPTGCATPPPAPPPPGPTTQCVPDLPLAPAAPFEMPNEAGDEYVCYGVDVTRPTPTHVVGFAPHVDNTKIVHHVLLFEADSSYPTTPQKCSAGGSLQWRLVTGWAPGAKGFEMPPEAGFALASGANAATHYIVQVHYSNPQALAGEKDTSGFDLCTSAPRPNEADVMAFGTQKIDIPPGPYTKTCAITVPSYLSGIHLVAAMPHMHKLGTAISTTLTPSAGGPDVDLGSDPAFSFNTQAWHPITGVAQTNDVVKTTCSWTNNTGGTVKFGENTADEMCYSFTVYWPKINVSVWTWAAPAYLSTCDK